ncbi:MAG: UDP-3-O-acyl-N-acetylglucosamine deacetylase, partial [Armatimonadota bacterium]
MNPLYQRTVREPVTISGRGLHTGEECELTLLPAEPDAGIVFRTKAGEVPARLAYVSGTNR